MFQVARVRGLHQPELAKCLVHFFFLQLADFFLCFSKIITVIHCTIVMSHLPPPPSPCKPHLPLFLLPKADLKIAKMNDSALCSVQYVHNRDFCN